MKAKNKKSFKKEVRKIATSKLVNSDHLRVGTRYLMERLIKETIEEIEIIEKKFNYDLPWEANYQRNVLLRDLSHYVMAKNCVSIESKGRNEDRVAEAQFLCEEEKLDEDNSYYSGESGYVLKVDEDERKVVSVSQNRDLIMPTGDNCENSKLCDKYGIDLSVSIDLKL